MARAGWVKPLATAALAAGLVAATLLTATAASEGGFGKGTRGSAQAQTPQARPTQHQSDAKGGQRTWAWVGEVTQSSLEGGHLEIQGACGPWALLPATDEVKAALEGLVGQQAYVVGRVSTEPNIFMRPTVRAEQVVTEKDQVPEGSRLFPACGRQQPERSAQPALAGGGALGLLERLGLGGLREVPADQRFEHLLGAQIDYLDAEGKLVTARLIAGAVTAVASDSLTLDPNGPEAALTVTVGAETHILRPGGGGLVAIVPGDKVLIVQVGGQTAAIVASKQVTATVWPGGLGHLFGQGGGGDLERNGHEAQKQAAELRKEMGKRAAELQRESGKRMAELRREAMKQKPEMEREDRAGGFDLVGKDL